MACKLQLRENIIRDVEQKSAPGFNMSIQNAKSLAAQINSSFQSNVVRFFIEADMVSREVTVSEELVNDYYNSQLRIEENEARGVQAEDAQRAGEEYNDDYLFLNTSQQNTIDSVVQKLENFELFEDTEKLCGQGICDFTSLKSTERLKEVGLNPYGNLTGQSLSVTVNSPLGDFGITHYVSATVINNGVYIYDMPQHEFISDKFFGTQGVKLKTTFKPRLIPLTVEDISSNYLLTEKEAINFIQSIIEQRGSNLHESFKSYLSRNIPNSEEYINELTSLYKNNNVQDNNIKRDIIKKDKLEKIINDPLSETDKKRLSSLLVNKFKIKTRQYIPRKSKNFFLSEFLEKTIGYTGFQYDFNEGFETVLEKLRIFLRSEEFIENLKRQYDNNDNNFDSYIESIFEKRRLINTFISHVKTDGWDNALNKFDKNQRYEIQIATPANYEQMSESQRIFRLRQFAQNLDNFISPMGLKMKPGDTRLSALFRENNKAKARLLKIKNTIDLMKSSNDVDFLFNLLSIEARRQYSYFEKQGQKYFQISNDENTPTLEMSKASPETLEKVKQVVEKMGVKIQTLEQYAKDAEFDMTNVEGVADQIRGIIAIAAGKENEVLTEEMVHMATKLVEEMNPRIMDEMISKIPRFKIYQQTYDIYSKLPLYQKNGKPDVRKIRKEAVDKLLAELIVYNNEGSTEFPELRDEGERSFLRLFWQKILDFILGQYRATNIDIFQQVSENIFMDDLGTFSGTGEIMLNVSNEQKQIQDRILDTASKISKVESNEKVEPLLLDTEEASNWYELKLPTGELKRIKNRVTDRVRRFYQETFSTKTFTKEEQAFNEFKRDNGVKYHKFLEEIHGRYFEKDGTRKTSLGPRPVINSAIDREIFKRLESYFVDLVKEHSKNGAVPLVFSEAIVYDDAADEAGTLDILIIDPDGTANIYDWKFMSRGANSDDIAWYKKGAYNIQLGRYKGILLKNYGVKKMGKNRAIPIVFNLERTSKTDDTIKITGITMGSIDKNAEVPLYLVPFSEETESTGYDKLDEVIQKLNAVQKQVQKEKVTTDEEKEFKRERLQSLQRASRVAHATQNLQPLLEVLELTKREGEIIISDYTTTFSKKDPNDPNLNNEEISEFAEDIRNFMSIAQAFTSIDILLGDLIYTEDMEENEENAQRREIRAAFERQVLELRKSINDTKKISMEFADKFIGQRNNVTGLLNEEAVVKGLSSTFRGVSEIPLKATTLLYKMTSFAKNKASQAALERVNKLLDIKSRLEKRNVDLREHVKQIYQKNADGFVNKLIHKYSKDFYTLMDQNSKEGFRNKKTILDNIDVEAYKKDADKILENRIRYLKKLYDNDPEGLDDLIKNERQKWDITRADFNGWNNNLIKRYPLDKWLSPEYIALKADQELFELYNLVTEINMDAKEVGYISNKVANTFLPFVRKSGAEAMAWGGMGKAVSDFGESLNIRAGDVGYGQINELTGEIENSIPKYHTFDFTRKKDGEVDNSDLSEEIFQNLVQYTRHLETYRYLSEIEDQIQMIKTVESFKNHLETSATGDVIRKGDKFSIATGNTENLKLLDNFTRVLLYDQRYPISDSDTAINAGTVIQGMKKLVNKVAGKEVLTVNENPNPMSMVKTIDLINRGFQIKTLGFELVSGAANAFGGNIQVATQSGNYFSASEFLKNEGKLIGNAFSSKDEREAFVQLVEKFMPMKDDPSYELFKKAGMSTLTSNSFSDILMVFMRYPEQLLEKSVFLTLLENSMVENGKIVSIPEFVKNKYPDRYKNAAQYQQTKGKIESEIDELKKTRSIWVTKKLEDGKLSIPGLDLNNFDELHRLTRLTRTISRNATGGLADSDVNQASMSIWLRSMMVFKNWIPKLLDTRFGELRKVYDDFSVQITDDGMTLGEKYDIGRIRLWAYVMGTSIRDASFNTMNILSMNDKGIQLLDKMYKEFSEKYETRTGQPFTMSREDFIDMIRNNLRNQVKEISLLLSLVSATFAMGLIAPDDDDSKAAKNAYRYYQKVLDKFIGELSFFYNPVEFQKMLSGSAFPAMGIFSDLIRFITHLTMQISGMDISDTDLTSEEVRKKAQPVKNLARLFPVTKSVVTYGAIISDDFAREFDVTIQKDARR